MEDQRDPDRVGTNGEVVGRDGCRNSLPWTAAGTGFGFGEGVPWLPQPENWGQYSPAETEADPNSMLSLYRKPGIAASNSGPRRWRADLARYR